MDFNIPQALLQISPGIVGIAFSKLFDGDSRDKPVNNTTIKYFLFTVASYICTFITSSIVEIFFKQLNLTKYNMLMAIVFAFLLGILWPIYLRNIVVSLTNKINKANNKNPIFLEEHLLEKNTRDTKPHYLKVFKEDKVIASGWLTEYQDRENAIRLQQSDEYPESELKEVCAIVYLDKHTVIKEYK